jgi:hypothetical protein
MHSRTYNLHKRDPWRFCLTAVAAVIDRLPPLYRVAERGIDDVAVELHLKAGAWEVRR